MESIRNKLQGTIVYLGHYCNQYSEIANRVIEIPKPDKTKISSIFNGCVDVFCVVGKNEKEDWATLLSFKGLRYGQDYIDEILADYIVKKDKKLAVIYGNCQMHDYFDCLNMSDEFNEKYYSLYFKYQDYPRWKEDKFELSLRMCSLLICTNENFDARYRNCREYIHRHNKEAIVISIPTYCYRGYFPQTNSLIQAKGEFDIISELFNSFHREDKTINRMIKDGYTVQEIISQIQSEKTFTLEEINTCNQISLMQIEAMDRMSDVKIFEYVLENYKKFRLFKDPVHMENCLVWYISMKILSLLGMNNNLEMPSKEIHYFTQLPIYPEVMRELKLTWTDFETTKIRLKEGMIRVSLSEFITRYYQFVKNASEIKRSLTINNEDNVVERFSEYEN